MEARGRGAFVVPLWTSASSGSRSRAKPRRSNCRAAGIELSGGKKVGFSPKHGVVGARGESPWCQSFEGRGGDSR